MINRSPPPPSAAYLHALALDVLEYLCRTIRTHLHVLHCVFLLLPVFHFGDLARQHPAKVSRRKVNDRTTLELGHGEKRWVARLVEAYKPLEAHAETMSNLRG
eukprot:1836102-Rhodomonas_salina.2